MYLYKGNAALQPVELKREKRGGGEGRVRKGGELVEGGRVGGREGVEGWR